MYCLLELWVVVFVGGLGVEAEPSEFLFNLVDVVVGVDCFEFVVEFGEEWVPSFSAVDLFGVWMPDSVKKKFHCWSPTPQFSLPAISLWLLR